MKDITADEQREKQAVRDFFDNITAGCFIDVGANEPISQDSQTWHLEEKLQWKGLLVEPLEQLAEKCRKLRPTCIVEQCVCTSSDKTGSISFFVPVIDDHEKLSHATYQINVDEHNYDKHAEYKVPAETLSSLIDKHNMGKIDFLSIDVEGTEYDVLQGLDLTRHRPRLILLEDKHLYLRSHLYLKANKYVLAKRQNRNSWYVLADGPIPTDTFWNQLKLFKRMYLSIWPKKLTYALRHKTFKPFTQL